MELSGFERRTNIAVADLSLGRAQAASQAATFGRFLLPRVNGDRGVFQPWTR